MIQSTDTTETYANGMSKDLLTEKEEIRCNIITEQYKK